MLKAIGIIVIVAIAGWIFGFFNSGGDTKEANDTAVGVGVGCGSLLLQLFIAGITILAILWLFGAVFG